MSRNPLEIISCDSDDESEAAYAESSERRKSLNPLDCLLGDEMENLTSTYKRKLEYSLFTMEKSKMTIKLKTF